MLQQLCSGAPVVLRGRCIHGLFHVCLGASPFLFVRCQAEGERESVMQSIEASAQAMRDDGSCAAWAASAGWSVKATACDVNGPLLEFLARACGFHDEACVEFFRKGAKLFGRLPRSGNGVQIPPDESWDPDSILRDREARNMKVE